MLARKKRYGLNSIFAQKLFIFVAKAAKQKLYILVLHIEIIKWRTTGEDSKGQEGNNWSDFLRKKEDGMMDKKKAKKKIIEEEDEEMDVEESEEEEF